MTLSIHHHPSPNYDDRPHDAVIDMIVIHAIGGYDIQTALNVLCDPDPQKNGRPHGPVSAHYVIDYTGDIYSLVPEDKRAWHAGVSAWKDRKNLNYCSIGIELLNTDKDFNAPFDPRQIESVLALITQIKSRHPIARDGIVGHDAIAPDRKADPGPHFPWSLVQSLV